jgi:hypothetical protein
MLFAWIGSFGSESSGSGCGNVMRLSTEHRSSPCRTISPRPRRLSAATACLVSLLRGQPTREAYAHRRERSTGKRSSCNGQCFDLLWAGALASAVPDALGNSPSAQSGSVPDPVVETRASTARHTWPSWGIVGQAEEGWRCIARAHPLTTINTLDSDLPWS